MIELFILDIKNLVQIEKSLKDYYSIECINRSLLYSITKMIRKYIAQYYKELYMLPLIEENKGEFEAIDESFFCHNYNNE